MFRQFLISAQSKSPTANPKQKSVPGGIRTPNLLIRSQLLYPVELQTRCGSDMSQVTSGRTIRDSAFARHMSLVTLESRVVDGTRTRNNQNHNLGLYH